jgi:hypothetical protein
MDKTIGDRMTDERYDELMEDDNLRLTQEEIDEGWHFCMCEWDGLLIHKRWKEAEFCCYFRETE